MYKLKLISLLTWVLNWLILECLRNQVNFFFLSFRRREYLIWWISLYHTNYANRSKKFARKLWIDFINQPETCVAGASGGTNLWVILKNKHIITVHVVTMVIRPVGLAYLCSCTAKKRRETENSELWLSASIIARESIGDSWEHTGTVILSGKWRNSGILPLLLNVG